MMDRRGGGNKSIRKALCLILALCLSVAPVVAQESSGDSEKMTEDYN